MTFHRTVSSLLLVAAAATPLGAASYTVGSSAVDCDFTSLTLALAFVELTADSDELRLTRTLSYSNVNLFISDWDAAVTGNLTLSGGWDDCLDPTPSGDTVIDGYPEGVVVEISESGASELGLYVVLRDLEITGANTGVAVGGTAPLGAPAAAFLESTVVHGNEHGVASSFGALVEIDAASVVRNNVAMTPGGLFGAGLIVRDAGSEIRLAGTVRENEIAPGFGFGGGGAFVEDGAKLTLLPGARIEANSAGEGGGISVRSGGQVDGGGTGALPVRIVGNEAIAGGGIWALGLGTLVTLSDVRIESNEAGTGAGIGVSGAASVQLFRAPGAAPCLEAPRCVTLSHNQLVGGEGFGSAVYADNGGEFRMFQGFIEGNGGFGDRGWLILGYTQDNFFELEGVQIWNNRARSIFQIYTSELVAGFLTVAGNSFWDPGTASFVDSIPAESYFNSTIEIYTSIYRDHAAWVKDAGSEIHVDCLVLETTTGTTSAGANMLGVDPLFRDAAGGDLRLRPGSPAIDGCDTFLYTPLFRDYEGDLRGYDSATAPNTLGPYDRGADESPLLFASGFEGGGLSGWSATVP